MATSGVRLINLKLGLLKGGTGFIHIRRSSMTVMARWMCSSSESKKPIAGTLNLTKLGKAKTPTVDKDKSKANEEIRTEDGIDSATLNAVDSVAKSMGSKGHQVKSDLLKKLRHHAEKNEELKNADTTNVSVLFSGMKVDSSSRTDKSQYNRSTESNGNVVRRRAPRKDVRDSDKSSASNRAPYKDSVNIPDIHLFDGPAVGIFTAKGLKVSATSEPTAESLGLFNILEKEELDAVASQSPMNAYEEMINWTKEGKLWTFPIDNDQGLTEEAKVGFHEHVFLDSLLENFPKKGPVRYFMELVIVGLSKNSYMTVEEKKNHVKWFEEYFEDKYHYFEDNLTTEFQQSSSNAVES